MGMNGKEIIKRLENLCAKYSTFSDAYYAMYKATNEIGFLLRARDFKTKKDDIGEILKEIKGD